MSSDSGVDSSHVFILDSLSGDLRVSGQLDADDVTGGVNFFVLNVTAKDSGSSPRSTHGALRVLVTGVNDNPPVWNISILEVEVYENASIGDDVITMAATDGDGGTVVFTTSDDTFEVVGSTLKIKQQLDFEQERCHTVTIR